MRIIVKSIIGAMFALFLISCKNVVPYSVKLPPPPPILKVDVLNNCACGESLEAIQENWLNMWEYIEELQTLGNFKQKSSKEFVLKYKCMNGRFSLKYMSK